jgi:hypothetical protein
MRRLEFFAPSAVGQRRLGADLKRGGRCPYSVQKEGVQEEESSQENRASSPISPARTGTIPKTREEIAALGCVPAVFDGGILPDRLRLPSLCARKLGDLGGQGLLLWNPGTEIRKPSFPALAFGGVLMEPSFIRLDPT